MYSMKTVLLVFAIGLPFHDSHPMLRHTRTSQLDMRTSLEICRLKGPSCRLCCHECTNLSKQSCMEYTLKHKTKAQS